MLLFSFVHLRLRLVFRCVWSRWRQGFQPMVLYLWRLVLLLRLLNLGFAFVDVRRHFQEANSSIGNFRSQVRDSWNLFLCFDAWLVFFVAAVIKAVLVKVDQQPFTLVSLPLASAFMQHWRRLLLFFFQDDVVLQKLFLCFVPIWQWKVQKFS